MERRRCLRYAPHSRSFQQSLLSLSAGDKSNHIATIHLAQMLYFWPYIAFFSLPLLYPTLLNAVIPQRFLPSFLRTASQQPRRPRLVIALPSMALMLAIVHYNTIIHPFTLADNRHYTFYVFKLLRQHPSLKYLAIPIYLLSAWAALHALALPSVELNSTPTNLSNPNQPAATKPNTPSPSPNDPRTATNPPQRCSTLLIWLATATLTLCSAPLVEPRYCILPWLIWRIHLPIPSSSRLWLETIWFVCINAVTGYLFLYREFEWRQEPGVVQRFMW